MSLYNVQKLLFQLNRDPATRKRFAPKWQETDPQLPKSRWWLSDAPFCGFRVVCEP